MLGAIVACALLAGLLPGPLAVTPSLGGGTTLVQGLFIEVITCWERYFTAWVLLTIYIVYRHLLQLLCACMSPIHTFCLPLFSLLHVGLF